MQASVSKMLWSVEDIVALPAPEMRFTIDLYRSTGRSKL
jgi:hypothetical protein